MERPSWLPIVFAGAVPRGLNDSLAMIALGLIGMQSLLTPIGFASIPVGSWALVAATPMILALASMTDTSRRLREELALLAYGSAAWYIAARYFLRGLVCALVAITPFVYLEYSLQHLTPSTVVLATLLVPVAGGLSYATPALSRMRSKKFAENYKG